MLGVSKNYMYQSHTDIIQRWCYSKLLCSHYTIAFPSVTQMRNVEAINKIISHSAHIFFFWEHFLSISELCLAKLDFVGVKYHLQLDFYKQLSASSTCTTSTDFVSCKNIQIGKCFFQTTEWFEGCSVEIIQPFCFVCNLILSLSKQRQQKHIQAVRTS